MRAFIFDIGDEAMALYCICTEDMQFPFVMGIPEFMMLDPKAGVCGEHVFIEDIGMVFMEYVEVMADIAFEEAVDIDESEYSFCGNIFSPDRTRFSRQHTLIPIFYYCCIAHIKQKFRFTVLFTDTRTRIFAQKKPKKANERNARY